MKNFVLVIVVACSLFSCKNDTKKEKKNSVVKEKSSYLIIGKELLKNVKFNRWDTNAKPSFWEINENLEKPEEYVVDRDTLDLLLNGLKDSKIFIKQNIRIDSSGYYLFKGEIDVKLESSSYAGVSIMSNGVVIGKRIFGNSTKKYSVVFNSKKNSEISVYIGFLEESIGRVMIKSISLKRIEPHKNIFKSKIAQKISSDLLLDFSSELSYDASVMKIIKYSSDIMLSKKRKDSTNMINRNEISILLEDNSNFKKYLSLPIEKITHSYPTKQVFSGIELLNEFNIGTRRIEFYKNKNRFHLSLMYYNPFSNNWNLIDPFYNSRIRSNENLSSLKKEDISILDFGGLSKNIDGLLKKYNGARIVIKKEKIIGYPF